MTDDEIKEQAEVAKKRVKHQLNKWRKENKIALSSLYDKKDLLEDLYFAGVRVGMDVSRQALYRSVFSVVDSQKEKGND